MILRNATPEDAPAVARLGRDAFCAAFGHLYQADDLDGFLKSAHSTQSVSAEIADPAMRFQLAVGDQGGLLGFCKLRMAPGSPEHVRGAPAIELKQLYTDPAATGRGIGAALMDWALATARSEGAAEVQLSVWSGNLGAQRFYARYGFEHIADIDFMVGRQRDEEFLFAKLL